jgi:hypothetical protein
MGYTALTRRAFNACTVVAHDEYFGIDVLCFEVGAQGVLKGFHSIGPRKLGKQVNGCSTVRVICSFVAEYFSSRDCGLWREQGVGRFLLRIDEVVEIRASGYIADGQESVVKTWGRLRYYVGAVDVIIAPDGARNTHI